MGEDLCARVVKSKTASFQMNDRKRMKSVHIFFLSAIIIVYPQCRRLWREVEKISVTKR